MILSQYFLDLKVSLDDATVNTLQKDPLLPIETLSGDTKEKGKVETKGHILKGFQGFGSCDGFKGS